MSFSVDTTSVVTLYGSSTCIIYIHFECSMDDDQEVVNLTNLSGAVAVQHASAVEATIHNAMERDVPDERIHGLEREIWAIQ